MRVLIVGLATIDEMMGGSARYLSGLAEALRTEGHEVRVMTATGKVARSGSRPGMRSQLSRSARRLLLEQPKTAMALRWRPHILNIHFAYDGLLPAIVARLIGIPIVVVFHGPWADEAVATGRKGSWPLSTRMRRFAERLVYGSASRVIVLSTAFKEILVDRYGIAGDVIEVIPGALDVGRFAATPSPKEARSLLGLPERPTVVTVRRLVPRMGLDIALDAIALLPTEPALLVAGDGPERSALERRAVELGIADRVSFLGRVPDVDLPLVYAAAELCLVPTRSLEGFGYVALEAFAAGRPVIATRVGGLVDLVGGLDERLLVDPEAGAIAAAIEAAYRGRLDLPDEDTIRRYAERYAWTTIVGRVVGVFQAARSSPSGDELAA
jgi:glycosyltransferase involved in cell wall biosynthesis